MNEALMFFPVRGDSEKQEGRYTFMARFADGEGTERINTYAITTQ